MTEMTLVCLGSSLESSAHFIQFSELFCQDDSDGRVLSHQQRM